MVAERELTARLARFFGSGPGVIVGIGDDAAVVANRSRRSVVCCDPVVEGVHYRADDPPRLVGQKVVNRNLADLAAMGALPDWLLVSLVLGPRARSRWTDDLLYGIRAAARQAKCLVIGGDVASSPGPTVVTVTALGHLATRRALRRDGARAGDTLHVSGPLGGSIAGHHLRFRPPLAVGAWLAGQAAVHAAMDVSDGLALDLATLLAASAAALGQELGAELEVRTLPIRAVARRLAKGDRRRALRSALGDGEDHVLLWSQGRELAAGGPLTATARRPIGRVTAASGLWLVHRDGRREALDPIGFQHDLG